MNYSKLIKAGLLFLGLEALVSCSAFQQNVSIYRFSGNDIEVKKAKGLIQEVIDYELTISGKKSLLSKEVITRRIYRMADSKSPFFYITLEEAKSLYNKYEERILKEYKIMISEKKHWYKINFL